MNGVKDIYREERVSKKSGNKYQVIVVEMENGYKYANFLNNEQQYCLDELELRVAH